MVTILALAAVRSIPSGWGRAKCRGLARLALRIRPRERERARANLARALPDLTPLERNRFLRNSADALGETLHATLTVDRLAAAGFPGVEDEPGPDGETTVMACRRLLAPGRGALLLTGHIGCWELLGAWLAHHLGPVAVVTVLVLPVVAINVAAGVEYPPDQYWLINRTM